MFRTTLLFAHRLQGRACDRSQKSFKVDDARCMLYVEMFYAFLYMGTWHTLAYIPLELFLSVSNTKILLDLDNVIE